VDVGANVGYFTLLLSELVGPLGKVHSVEALPSTVRHLRRNIALNPHASRVVLHDVACRDHEGKVEMFRADSIGNSSTGSGEHSEGMVRCTSLDSLVDETDRPRISLIKVDTEGDEMAVLLGATDTLSAMRPGAAAIVEVTPAMLSARGYEAGEVMDLMSGIGFDAHSIENDYTPSRYADCRVQSPKRLLRMPTTAQEVLFVKR
jgi:FkbM family methyltransferase